MRVRRWFFRRFLTRKTYHPWGRPQLSRRAWWDRSETFSVAGDSYEWCRAELDRWMDQAFAQWAEEKTDDQREEGAP